MRHEALFAGDGIEKVFVNLDAVDGGQAKPGKVGHLFEDRLNQHSQFRCSGQISAPGGGVHPGQHDLAVAVGDQLS